MDAERVIKKSGLEPYLITNIENFTDQPKQIERFLRELNDICEVEPFNRDRYREGAGVLSRLYIAGECIVSIKANDSFNNMYITRPEVLVRIDSAGGISVFDPENIKLFNSRFCPRAQDKEGAVKVTSFKVDSSKKEIYSNYIYFTYTQKHSTGLGVKHDNRTDRTVFGIDIPPQTEIYGIYSVDFATAEKLRENPGFRKQQPTYSAFSTLLPIKQKNFQKKF